MDYSKLSKSQLKEELQKLEKEYDKFKALNLSLNMARGKPCKAQLDLVMPMMDILDSKTVLSAEDGTDCRNYGLFAGIDECKGLLADIMGVNKKNVVIYGNSSLNIMFNCVNHSFTHGIMGSTPLCKLDKVKWLCPVPGYDRHFNITEYFNFEMINIPMNKDGPDMDLIEKLVKEDDSIKGIWCVPKYANPDGTTYSDEVVTRFAKLKPKAKDFRIYWDNAYVVHHLYKENQDKLLDIISECEKAGNPDLVYEFASTSKISFPGSGVSAMASSTNNLKDLQRQLTTLTIGFDKINMLRHVKYFKNLDGIKAQMEKHADVIRPKFELVLKTFDEELGMLNIANWTKPHGGYFISLNVLNGCAKAVIKTCKDLGVTLTGAGSTYPYHKDPNDSNIRIAPTFPENDELALAAKVLVLSVKMESIRKLLNA